MKLTCSESCCAFISFHKCFSIWYIVFTTTYTWENKKDLLQRVFYFVMTSGWPETIFAYHQWGTDKTYILIARFDGIVKVDVPFKRAKSKCSVEQVGVTVKFYDDELNV
ncbi:hypothetical protein MIMGU_mgv1a019557mg, partial [Erythranthe guttata]